MADTPAKEILDTLMTNLKQIISTKSVVGEPVQVGKTTILPIMKVTMGFGAGGGNWTGKVEGSGGGGGGVSITPVGFLVVEEGRAMMVTPQSSKWDWVVDSIPDMIERLAKVRSDYKKEKDSSSEPSSKSAEQ